MRNKWTAVEIKDTGWFAVYSDYRGGHESLITQRTLDPEDARLIAAAPELLEALQIICANARIQPDASMDGSTDCYAVPLDDIDSALALLAQINDKQ